MSSTDKGRAPAASLFKNFSFSLSMRVSVFLIYIGRMFWWFVWSSSWCIWKRLGKISQSTKLWDGQISCVCEICRFHRILQFFLASLLWIWMNGQIIVGLLLRTCLCACSNDIELFYLHYHCLHQFVIVYLCILLPINTNISSSIIIFNIITDKMMFLTLLRIIWKEYNPSMTLLPIRLKQFSIW